VKYNPGSIARALDHHRSRGAVKRWTYDPQAKKFFLLLPARVWGPLEGQWFTHREAHILCLGLAAGDVPDPVEEADRTKEKEL
jgi:hypothetical protein